MEEYDNEEEYESEEDKELRREFDEASKEILAYKKILANILKAWVPEYKSIPLDEVERCIEGNPEVRKRPLEQKTTMPPKIVGSRTEDASAEEGTVRYDIVFTALAPYKDYTVKLIINIESQGTIPTKYPILKRCVYYLSRLLASQKGKVFTRSEYGKLQKVYSIWIFTCPRKDNKKSAMARFKFDVTEAFGEIGFDKSDADLMELIIIQLDFKSDEKSAQDPFRLLETIFSTELKTRDKKKILEGEYSIPLSEGMESKLDKLGSIAAGFIEDARREVRELKSEIAAKDHTIEVQGQEIAAKDHTIEVQGQELAAQSQEIAAQSQEIAAQSQEIAAKDHTIEVQGQELAIMKKLLEENGISIPSVLDAHA